MSQSDTLLHLFAGGCGGTVGAIVTCPLEVIKTRLQSSGLTLRQVYIPQVNLNTINGPGVVRPTRVAPGLFQVLKMILEKEGPRSLFRGLGPNLIGVAPSRAIYFAAYSKAKEHCNTVFVPHSNLVHMCSAGFASFITNTLMNPIWLVKTRMQLESRKRSEKVMNAFQCAKHVYRAEGFKGFYRGLTASYAGISETMIHFVTYEAIKKHLEKSRFNSRETDKTASDFLGLMLAAGFSKTCASCAAYPHEVIRTRLREEGTKYKTFLQTARVVAMEEGYSAFYRGLQAQLIRQIPNTAIMMTTYEVIIYVFGHH
ncbi:solute carrier family 25 member 33 [Callorhinchus milii]|uniref:Solute carrier family 25 member 33 n=2 Tax=Callorhinchus milii TaxID=7868 RepID=V9KU96_CALMI|nr:solute carrier family 25 member 33 [Callorhinchus milii]|eukprot:gi/632967928/ref/XP_007900254.1/ PREDICTED: solute carrier family 25 member 33 [Callorhinchus milii]